MGDGGEEIIRYFMAERRFSDDEPIMVSIRCITYNHAPYIRQCLEGFVMQKTNFRFQAVVHDDASTDGTTDIVREYAEKYPDIIVPMYEEENRWSKHDGSLLTIMYPLLVGKYLAHCEGDDFWTDPYKLQKQVDFLETHPDYVLTYTDYSVVDINSQVLNRKKTRRYSGECTDRLLIKGNFIFTGTSLYRREYDNEWPSFLMNLPVKTKQSDYVHWLFLSKKGLFKYISENTTSYRLQERSASHFTEFEDAKNFFEKARDVRLFFNNYYNVGISNNKLKTRCNIDTIRASAMYGRNDFCSELKKGIKETPTIFLNPKIWALVVARLFLNKKV